MRLKPFSQNYICVDCKRQFLDCYQIQKGSSDEFKRECLTMYVNGMGFQAIARVKGINHVTVINWVKQVGKLLLNAYDPGNTTQVGELETLIFLELQTHQVMFVRCF